MSFRTNFQVNTHIQSNFLILKPPHPIETSPTQISNDSPQIFPLPPPSPPIRYPTVERGLETNEELVKHQEIQFHPIGTDITVRNGKNTASPCNQNILTRTVHTKPRIPSREGTAARRQLFCPGWFLTCSLTGSRSTEKAKRKGRRALEGVGRCLRSGNDEI